MPVPHPVTSCRNQTYLVANINGSSVEGYTTEGGPAQEWYTKYPSRQFEGGFTTYKSRPLVSLLLGRSPVGLFAYT